MGSRTPPTSDIVEGRDAGLGLEDVLCGWRWCCHRTSKTRDARERRTSMCSSRPCCAPLTMCGGRRPDTAELSRHGGGQGGKNGGGEGGAGEDSGDARVAVARVAATW